MLDDSNISICLSAYQLGEIFDLFRKYKIDRVVESKIYQDFFTEKFIIRNLCLNHFKEAYKLSKRSLIHIYDYFVVLPIEDIVDKIYSADDHFQHKDFTSICKVTNPLFPWILREGREPEKI